MTPFHVGASNQPCGIQTSQPGPAVSHSIMAAHPGRRQELLIVGSDNYTGLFSTQRFSSWTQSDRLNVAAGLELASRKHMLVFVFRIFFLKPLHLLFSSSGFGSVLRLFSQI